MKRFQDYVAISAIWYERFLECSRTNRTSEFVDSVYRFYNSLLDLDDKDLAIKKKVDGYYKDSYIPVVDGEVKQRTRYVMDNDAVEAERSIVEREHINKLFHFIIQTIQDSGIGWGTSEYYDRYHLSQD